MTNTNQNNIFDVLYVDLIKKQTQNKKFSSFPTCSTLISYKQTSSDNENSESFPQKTKKIKRKRVYESNSKWTDEDVLNYWKFYIQLAILMPYLCISWRNWKIDSLFIKMSKALNKTPKQCKSFDERMKNSYFSNQRDLLDVAYLKLQESSKIDNESSDYLKKYIEVCLSKSQHMEYLDKKIQMSTKIMYQLQTLAEFMGLEK